MLEVNVSDSVLRTFDDDIQNFEIPISLKKKKTL